MKISVIVPMFKVEKEIENCLISIMKQDYPNLEIVLVDDCSPDNSLEIAKRVIESHRFSDKTKFVLHEKNKGISVARNSGLSYANGEYIFFLDSDDEIASHDVISYLASLIKSADVMPELIIGNFYRILDNTITEADKFKHREYRDNREVFKAYSNGYFWHTAWGKLINKDFLLSHKICFSEGIYHEDELWFFDIMKSVKYVKMTPKIIYSYRKREGSITSHITERHIEDMNFVISKMYESYNHNKPCPKKETSRIIERFRRSTLKKIFSLSDVDNQFKQTELDKLKSIKLSPLASRKARYFRQNLLLRLPNNFIIGYLSLKWKRYRA